MTNEAQVPEVDRRASDVNVTALSVRIQGLQGPGPILEEQGDEHNRELKANTELTKQANKIASEVHDAVIGVDENPGVEARVKEMYEIFDAAREGLRLLERTAARTGKTADWLSKNGQRIFWIGAVAG